MTRKYMQRIPVVVTLSLLFISPVFAQLGQWDVQNLKLADNWEIYSSEEVQADGEMISTENYQPEDWYPATVPTTVMAALVELGEYENIFFDNNLEKISGERFDAPWWYRTQFTLDDIQPGQVTKLRFNGINYRADVWVNGEKIASSDSLKGGFRHFTFDVSDVVKQGENTLAVKVFHTEPGDPTLGFVDWNPVPPDRNMGIWRDVEVQISGPVSINLPFVKTDVDTTTLDRADLTISAVIQNHSDKRINGTLTGLIGDDISVEQEVRLDPGESQKIIFTPDQYNQLIIQNPRLWWTHTLGEPNLYDLELSFRSNDSVSDLEKVRFGIRSVTDYITQEGHRGFKLNGKKILIKGGGYTDPMLLNATEEYEEAAVDYAVHMNLNTLRFEGFWGNDHHLYDLCDEKGILVMIGWSAQWEWTNYFGSEADQFGGVKSEEQMMVAAKSWQDQITWLRNHPSISMWVYGSDKLPRPALEEKYLAIKEMYPSNAPYVGAAQEHNSIYTGPTAMKMRGPYDYVPPSYWYTNTTDGGAFGFNTETGPGPQIPLRESLEKMIPADSLWPISDSWLYHAARGEFHDFEYYNRAMNQRLGEPEELEDYLRKAQFLNYEGMRAMFEAFESNRYEATGIIQWMYNSSWPKLWWQLYDYYLLPNASFYGARKANEPVHISYNYGSNQVEVMNNRLEDESSLTADIRLLDDGLNPVVDEEIAVENLPGRKTIDVFDLPESPDLSSTYFLDLILHSEGEMISNNFYVLSTTDDEVDDSQKTWFVTPQSQFADLTELENLPDVELNVQKEFEQKSDTTFATVTLENPSSELAFMVHLNLRKSESDESVVPIFWDDNYISLLPGEKITIQGFCKTRDLEGEDPSVVISGWNIQ